MPDIEREYQSNVGRPHKNLPEDHPDYWQWEYMGTKEEREDLERRVKGEDIQEPLFEP